jgi:DNA-directed RNA polymerase beta' subunit
MLQEAVDSLFDNSRKSNAVKTDANRPSEILERQFERKTGTFPSEPAWVKGLTIQPVRLLL